MSSNIIEIKNLKKQFLVKKSIFQIKPTFILAVDNVTLNIKKGEILGLVGSSGSGKTTLARCILRLLERTSGDIYFHGKSIFTLKGKQLSYFRRKVQMIFQNPYESLNPRFTVFDILIEPLVIHKIGTLKEKIENIKKILEIVNLIPADEFLYRFPHELSGGQRQRVAIARALILFPEFIVCDEPVSMLDVSIRCSILNLFKELQKKFNLTLLFITHDLAVAQYISDRIVVMSKGKIVEEGKTDKLIQNPTHPYTKELISAVPKISYFNSRDISECNT
jgi:ABC-type oligopeptide transport system ATPase subunit